MPAEGLIKCEGSITIINPIEPRQCVPINLFVDGGKVIEKIVFVHCLPSDQALDLYVFDAVNNAGSLIEHPPFDLFYEGNRALRLEQDTSDTYDVIMKNGSIASFALRHAMDEKSLSLS